MGTYTVSSVYTETCSGASLQSVNNLTVNTVSQQSVHGNSKGYLENGHRGEGMIHQVSQDGRMVVGESISRGPHNLTKISFTGSENGKGNVHSGAPPPWFGVSEQNKLNDQLNSSSSTFVSSSHGSSKSHKLDPKRVGAASAERRKKEIEMEKRGEVVCTDYDASWLPNFGRVWQSGSQKESRKQFEMQNQKQ